MTTWCLIFCSPGIESRSNPEPLRPGPDPEPDPEPPVYGFEPPKPPGGPCGDAVTAESVNSSVATATGKALVAMIEENECREALPEVL
jgi:hypothetical protein